MENTNFINLGVDHIMAKKTKNSLTELENKFFKGYVKKNINPAAVLEKLKYNETNIPLSNETSSNIVWDDNQSDISKKKILKKILFRKRVFFIGSFLILIAVVILLFIWGEK